MGDDIGSGGHFILFPALLNVYRRIDLLPPPYFLP
jgi:hypothetical protein